jgi:hypothetical protein
VNIVGIEFNGAMVEGMGAAIAVVVGYEGVPSAG